MKTFNSFVMGSFLTYIFFQFGVKPPEILFISDKIKAFLQQIIAMSLMEDTDSNIKQQQHAKSTLI